MLSQARSKDQNQSIDIFCDEWVLYGLDKYVHVLIIPWYNMY